MTRALACWHTVMIAFLGMGCGGNPPKESSAPPSAAPAGTATGIERPLTQAQLDVAHFRSADGFHGLVLDRTQAKPKLKVDGQKDVIELTPSEDRFSGELRGHFLVAPDGTRPIYVTVDGRIKYLKGNDEYWMNSDRESAPLPRATITGTYVEPPAAYQATVDRLTGISVRTKFPEFKPEDSARLDKIGEAVERATGDMFVHYLVNGSTSWLPSLVAVPNNFAGIEFSGVARRTDEKWVKGAKGLAGFGGKIGGFSEYRSLGNHMQVMALDGYPPNLANGTPGLVWEVDGLSAILVTLDGARYSVDLSAAPKGQTLEAGAGLESQWPAPLQHSLVDLAMVSGWVKAGALPQQAIDELLKLDDDWNQCAQKIWKMAEKQIDSGRFTEANRKEFDAKVTRTCKKSIDAQEKALLKIIDERNRGRMDLLAKAKSRLSALGANR